MSEKLKVEVDTASCCNTLSVLLSKYNGHFKRKLDPWNAKRKINKKHYPFIPSGSQPGLIFLLKTLMKKLRCETLPPYKFLDCGCGIGNVMMLANTIGFATDGIEYDRKVHRIAKELTGSFVYDREAHVFHGDITTFRRYKRYDVIYFYVPISNGAKMKLFIDRVKDKAKVGAYFIPYSCGSYLEKDKRLKLVKLEWPDEVLKADFYVSALHLFKKVKD
jgi:hypothetical protein